MNEKRRDAETKSSGPDRGCEPFRIPDVCRCQQCNAPFDFDLLVADALWEQIKPKREPAGGGLLCPHCIIDRVAALPGAISARLEVRDQSTTKAAQDNQAHDA